jgi:hypothetical protein
MLEVCAGRRRHGAIMSAGKAALKNIRDDVTKQHKYASFSVRDERQ